MDNTKIIYDAQCPFCDNYVKYSRLKRTLGNIELIDARIESEEGKKLLDLGYDLNEGMVVISNDVVYFGSDAMWFLSVNSKTSLLWAPIRIVMRSKRLSKLVYPYLRFFRKLTLFILKIPEIKQLK